MKPIKACTNPNCCKINKVELYKNNCYMHDVIEPVNYWVLGGGGGGLEG